MINQKGFTHIIIAIGAFVAAGVIFVGAWWFVFGRSDDANTNTTNTNTTVTINSFTECEAAGYPVMESYPRQCAAGGKTFTEVITNTNTSVNQNVNSSTDNNSVNQVSYIAYQSDNKIYSLNTENGDTSVLLETSQILYYDITKDGQNIAYVIAKGDLETEVHIYNIGTQTDSIVLNDPLAYYHDIRLSPDGSKIAYVKKEYSNQEKEYLNQAVYYSEIDGTSETKIADTGKTDAEIGNIYGNDVCQWPNDYNLLGIEGWAPESNYVVYYINSPYECSGPGHDRIYITDLNGEKSFFDKYLPDPGTFDFNGNTITWLPVRIDWPINANLNDSFLLSQHAPIPMINSRVVTVENNEIKVDFNLLDYDDPEYKNNMQRIRSNYDYKSDFVVWDEKIHYFGSRTGESGSNESIQLYNSGKNETSTIIEAQTDLAYTNPLFVGDNKILYRRYNVEKITSTSGYNHYQKSDDYDLFIYDLSDESNRMLIENIIAEDIHGYIASATSGWQTYTNDEFNYLIQYPSNYNKIESNDGIILERIIEATEENYLGGTHKLIINVLENNSDNILYDWATGGFKDEAPSGYIVDSLNTININGELFSSFRVGSGMDSVINYFLVNGSTVYSIYSSVLGYSNESLNDSIIATFQLASDTSATSGWQTYTNDVYGFSFQFPSEWNQILDKIPTEVKEAFPGEGYVAKGIEITDENSSYPILELYVNPMGWGSQNVHKNFNVERENGKLNIVSEEVTGALPGEFALSNYYSVRVKEDYEGSSPINRIYLTVTSAIQDSSSAEFDAIARQIIDSFQFTQ